MLAFSCLYPLCCGTQSCCLVDDFLAFLMPFSFLLGPLGLPVEPRYNHVGLFVVVSFVLRSTMFAFLCLQPLCYSNQSRCLVDDSCCGYILSVNHQSKLPDSFCLPPSCSDHWACPFEVKPQSTMFVFGWLYLLCCGRPCWPFRGCIFCAVSIKVAALLMAPVVVLFFRLTTNQSRCRLVVDSWYLACCIDLSCSYYFLQSPVGGKCSSIFLHTARWVSAESFSGKSIASGRDSLCATRHDILFTRSVLRFQSVSRMEAKTRYNQFGLSVVISFVLTTNQSWRFVVWKVETCFCRRPLPQIHLVTSDDILFAHSVLHNRSIRS